MSSLKIQIFMQWAEKSAITQRNIHFNVMAQTGYALTLAVGVVSNAQQWYCILVYNTTAFFPFQEGKTAFFLLLSKAKLWILTVFVEKRSFPQACFADRVRCQNRGMVWFLSHLLRANGQFLLRSKQSTYPKSPRGNFAKRNAPSLANGL